MDARGFTIHDRWQEKHLAHIDGFVIAVPTANEQKFIDHANQRDAVFIEYGASRVLECWGDDVPPGKHMDFQRAVQARDDETVVFSWVEWPDNATRDAGMEKAMKDPRMSPETNPMPCEGKRLIFGGFAPIVELDSALDRSRRTARSASESRTRDASTDH